MQRNFTLCFHNIPFWFIEHWTVLNCKKIDEIACIDSSFTITNTLLRTEIHSVEIEEFYSLFILICNDINYRLPIGNDSNQKAQHLPFRCSSWIKKACFLFDEKKWELASSFCHFFQIITTVKRNTSSGNFLEALIMVLCTVILVIMIWWIECVSLQKKIILNFTGKNEWWTRRHNKFDHAACHLTKEKA